MVKIILIDGSQYINEPELGMNLSDKYSIQECLDDTGYYELCTEALEYKRIYKNEVEAIVQL